MSERFLKFIPSDEAMWLLKKKGHAFRLLAIIAESARRHKGDPDGLSIGECFIGGHTNYDMTEQNYRTAKDLLVKRQHIEIVETCRTRKKSTTGVTTVGTKVKLLSTSVWDINSEVGNDRSNDRPTTDQRPTNDKQECKEGISNDIPKIDRPRTAKRPRSVDALSFDHESWSFTGIAEKDVADWKLMYPHIDIQVETLKAAQWFKNNQSKSRRSSYRKYLTGWFGRENERIENKKAYRSASGGTSQDRRTKDIDGNPVDSPHTGRF